MSIKHKVLFFISTALFTLNAHADLPFEILPDGTLPTTVVIGTPVAAKYIVSNETHFTRTGNYVEYLPQNVVLNPTLETGDCAASFTLTAEGTTGDSCVLSLLVYGAVNGNDPDPKKHLFVCMSDHTTCAGTLYPLNVTVVPGGSTALIVSGTYAPITLSLADSSMAITTLSPWVAASADGEGNDWAYTLDSSNVPSDYQVGGVGIFFGNTCSEVLCLAAGLYSGCPSDSGCTTTDVFPTLAASTNAGVSWDYVIDSTTPTLPSDFNTTTLGVSSGFVTVECMAEDTLCAAGGTYLTDTCFVDSCTGDASAPLLAQSTNADLGTGATWTYKIDSSTPTLPSDYADVGLFTSVSCTDEGCVAVGAYQTDTEFAEIICAPTPQGGCATAPLIATTTDAGTSWNYVLNSGSLPGDYEDVGSSLGLDTVFNSVSCSAPLCVAVGQYLSTNVGANTYPLLATSTDSGTSWAYEIDSSTSPSVPSDYETTDGLAFFASVSCADEGCVAVGGYLSTDTNTYPMIARSADGITWTYVLDSSTSPSVPGDFGAVGEFISVDCVGTNCIAGGLYKNDIAPLYPMLARSTDSGVTWEYLIDSSTPTLPSDYDDLAAFIGVECEGEICLAEGTYESAGPILLPLLAQSTDNGATWTYVIDSSTPALPSDFETCGLFIENFLGIDLVAACTTPPHIADINEEINEEEKGFIAWLKSLFWE